MKKNILLILILSLQILGKAQEIKKPNFAFASHPMYIEDVNFISNHLIIKITIENKIVGGNFCLDNNTYIQNVLTNTKIILLDSENIAICPETYNFSQIGEKLTFQLKFLKPYENIKYMNVIEACNNHCFSINGVILDPEMNASIDSAFNFFNKGDYESSKKTLIKIIQENPDYPFGFLYLNLIQLLVIQNDIDEAKKYYKYLENSNFADKNLIIGQLNKEKELLK